MPRAARSAVHSVVRPEAVVRPDTAVPPDTAVRAGSVVRSAAAAGAAAGLAAGAVLLARELWRVRTEIGAPARVLRAAAAGSPAARGGRFRNTERSTPFDWSGVRAGLAQRRRRGSAGPAGSVPVRGLSAAGGAGRPTVTWLGHASVLLEIGGARVLTDPVLERRCSPSRLVGPSRLHDAPVSAAALPPIDAVVISHDHYDHLERSTMVALAEHHCCTFIVPTGVAAHLRRWGVPADRIAESGWSGVTEAAGLRFTCAEVRHFSGRGLRRDGTQWAGWCIEGGGRSVYFGGDSGYTAAFAATGAAHGPFDLTILPIGAYSSMWPDIHMDPEQALRACADLNGDAATVLLPVHWATFDLAPHPWAEPVERLCAAHAALPGGAPALLIPRPGERVDLDDPGCVPAPAPHPWWRGSE